MEKKWQLYKIIRRSIILFGLGLVVNNGSDLPKWRIPGVLQRFGVSYLVACTIVTFVPQLHFTQINPNHHAKEVKFAEGDEEEDLIGNLSGADKVIYYLRDIMPYLGQWIIALSLPILHTILTFTVDVPGCGTGYLGPGGIGDFGKYQNCTGGAAGYIDQLVFGLNHVYQHPTCKDVYQTGAYDPEGLIGNLTSIFICFLGVQLGRILLEFKAHRDRLTRWVVWGIVLGLFAGALCGFSQFSGPIPVNKNLWSLSFVLTMASLGYFAFSIYYVIIDLYGFWDGTPFIFPGANSIVVYCGSELLGDFFPFSWNTKHITHAENLAMNLVCVSLWVLISWYMYIQNFFINI